MNTGRLIKKILFATIWIAIGGGMLFLLIAAIGKQKRDHCRGYTINIKGAQKNFFVDRKDVQKILVTAAGGNIKGQKKLTLNLQKMEQMLEANVWIKDAELYFDNQEQLNVSVTERVPVARIFTPAGKSYYIDNDEKRMPLSDKKSASVPVFTGFPEKLISKRDSALLHNVRDAALFILDHSFWMSQVAQIDITAERNFEMVPVVGNHTVILGDGENIDRKFRRLFVFYKNVLSKTGFEKYKTINVQYAGQVVAMQDDNIKRDTARLRSNVEKLLRQAREMQDDSLVAARIIKEQKAMHADPNIAATEKSTDNDVNEQAQNVVDPVPMTDPVPVTGPVPMKPLLNPKDNEKQKPKAVMKSKRQ